MTEADETSELRHRLHQEIASRVRLEAELKAKLELLEEKRGKLVHALQTVEHAIQPITIARIQADDAERTLRGPILPGWFTHSEVKRAVGKAHAVAAAALTEAGEGHFT